MENTVAQLKKIKVMCLLEKKKHFNAAARKSNYNLLIGILLIALTVISSSVLLYEVANSTSGLTKYLPLIFSVASAFLSSIQTFFNFNKQVEGNKSIGSRYLATMKECELFLAFYQDNQISEKEFKDKVLELNIKVQQINTDAESYSTNNKDYAKANEGILSGEETYTSEEFSL